MSSNEEILFGQTAADVAALRYDRPDALSHLDVGESDWLICNMVPAGSRVLDIGCGTGVLLSKLHQACRAEVVGIEPNTDRAEAARSRGFDVRTGLATPELLTELGAFDVILFADVLEHLVDPGELLRAVVPALKADGRVVASIPNVAHWSVRTALLRGRFDFEPIGIMDSTHLRWFTEKSVRSLFADAGLTIREMRHSAGTWMRSYQSRPFTFVPARLRHQLIKRMTLHFPRLFGCQHIVWAVKTGA